MRPIRAMAATALLSMLMLSCDSTDPLRLEQQEFELFILGGGAQVPVYFAYDGFEDSDGDLAADDVDNDGQPDFFLWCIGTAEQAVANSTPVGFTVEISILPDGGTTRQLLTSDVASEDEDFSLSEYDSSPPLFGAVPARSAITEMDRTFRFRNGRRLRSVTRSVVQSTPSMESAWTRTCLGVGDPLPCCDGAGSGQCGNPLNGINPGVYALGNGLCSEFDPGEPIVDRTVSTSYPFTFQLGKGDTVTVKARRAVDLPVGITVNNPPAPGLAGALRLNGTSVSVERRTSGEGPAGGFTISYTSR